MDRGAVTLDQIAAGVDLESLGRDELVALLCKAGAAQARLCAALAETIVIDGGVRADRLLDVDEASVLLGVDKQWLYRRSRSLPFVVRLDGRVRFSQAGIQKFISRRTR